ncbi:16S rRNA (guanine(966)-N(2))-methyltransferase RsmD [Sneathiella aquimaris]|uniref:16S rRNA (guanine(966)-N(2))-methyltransferase RsmD n=1 Tax=Sneathiella aquimaris TaxID=2599305 RepID=UPI00146B470F|nr:16S rRNA (guanine(966)-N(2))-methyltransferase RsmD [Sneathiella aquimaris]
MRIVGGEFRGKKLFFPEDKRIRPTADRTREALFNILAHGSDYRTTNGALPLGVRVVDVFAGTGSLGVEALSRGASHVTFVDNHPASLKLIKENVALVDGRGKADILNRNGNLPGNAGYPADLVLMDPPYGENLALPCLEGLDKGGWLKENTIIVIELATKDKLDVPDRFETLDERKYGAAKLIFLRKN